MEKSGTEIRFDGAPRLNYHKLPKLVWLEGLGCPRETAHRHGGFNTVTNPTPSDEGNEVRKKGGNQFIFTCNKDELTRPNLAV